MDPALEYSDISGSLSLFLFLSFSNQFYFKKEHILFIFFYLFLFLVGRMFLFANKVVSRSKLQETFLRQLNDPSSPKEELLNCLHVYISFFSFPFSLFIFPNQNFSLSLPSPPDLEKNMFSARFQFNGC